MFRLFKLSILFCLFISCGLDIRYYYFENYQEAIDNKLVGRFTVLPEGLPLGITEIHANVIFEGYDKYISFKYNNDQELNTAITSILGENYKEKSPYHNYTEEKIMRLFIRDEERFNFKKKKFLEMNLLYLTGKEGGKFLAINQSEKIIYYLHT